MRIDRTVFGEITIDGETYDHDVIVRLSGGETQKETFQETVRYLAYCVEGRGKIRF